MRMIEIEAIITGNIDHIYKIVTNIEHYKWRSDVKTIIRKDEMHFTEYYGNGNYTHFTITKKRKNEEYAFDMENKMFTGEWLGKFEKIDENRTKIIFTEFMDIRNPIFFVLSYIFMNPKKMQKKYVKELEQEVLETS